MNSLKTVAAKVKHSPQVIRKTFSGAGSPSPYAKVTEGEKSKGKYQEDWLHAEESLKEGIHFYVKILGSCPVLQAQGSGCTDEAVQSIIANTKKTKNTPASGSLQKVLITVSTRKLSIEDMISKEKIMEIPIYRVSYCVADSTFPKVFAFICRSQGKQDLTCHAFLCSKPAMAQAMALTIADAFKLAYENHEKNTGRDKPEKDQGCSRVARDNKENTGQATPKVENENVDIYATPIPRKNRVDAPKIQLSPDSTSDGMEDSNNKFQALDLKAKDDDFDAEFTK
ncbi:Low density lipoprotein receptor adapter protein 1-A [Stylophora pistillata]|uniref:Low density lipoprotein receptor adapter protein 1-A n=2 Tax=Stylophora pistillata TaxID=50429 RepID=A0A2B4SS39_STYPI|nr:Low density lipoprotein receptor adapter protein 1-A [Stylophora pistillata]